MNSLRKKRMQLLFEIGMSLLKVVLILSSLYYGLIGQYDRATYFVALVILGDVGITRRS